MKGILCACLLAALQSMSEARAYEGDVHYSATYAIARAVGWPPADALIIASADEAMDQNPETVAALELDATPSATFAGYVTSSLHQAEKNLKFHCFSQQDGQPGGIPDDVRRIVAGHFANIPDADEEPRTKSRRLIALGVALHCQQDAYSHVGFGGSCGTYPGSCYGHTYEAALDQVVFGLLKKHVYNPDHPAVSGRWLQYALQETARALAAHRRKDSMRAIPADALIALSDALRASGVDLPDDVRRDCNRHLAGKWLFDLMHAARGTRSSPDTRRRLAPEVAVTCKNASLASATVIEIPAPRFPRLDSDASPLRVEADGRYEPVIGDDSTMSRADIGAVESVALFPGYDMRKITVQLSHWSQILSLPWLTNASAQPGAIGAPATTTLADAGPPAHHRRARSTTAAAYRSALPTPNGKNRLGSISSSSSTTGSPR